MISIYFYICYAVSLAFSMLLIHVVVFNCFTNLFLSFVCTPLMKPLSHDNKQSAANSIPITRVLTAVESILGCADFVHESDVYFAVKKLKFTNHDWL